MLSEEEKKAIEDIKLLSIGDFITWFNTDGIIKMGISAKTALNLVTKLQKENEELKTTINKQSIDTSNNLVKLQEKDKQIDLMAKEITMTKLTPCTRTNEFSMGRMYMSKEEIKQYFERRVEE